MKKLLISLALTLVLVMGAMFAACGKKDEKADDSGREYYPGASETFAGVVSDESYASEQLAAEAFVQNEINGTKEVELVSYSKKGELNESQKSELELDSVVEAGDTVQKVEVVEVAYSPVSASAAAGANTVASAKTDYKTITIYIVVVTPHGSQKVEYRYYVPISEEGDMLTKSYFLDVLDPAKYANCTETYTMSVNMTMGGSVYQGMPGGSLSSSSSIQSTTKIADKKVSSYNYITAVSGGYSDVQTAYAYIEEIDKKMHVWTSTNGTVYQYNGNTYALQDDSVESLDSIASMMMPDYDFSYYEKTNYGFRLNPQYFEDVLDEAFEEAGVGSTGVGMNINTKTAEIKFYVVGGKVEKATIYIALDMSMSYSDPYGSSSPQTLTMKMVESGEIFYKDFGTTVVTTPAGVDTSVVNNY